MPSFATDYEQHNLELQLQPTSNTYCALSLSDLKLSIGREVENEELKLAMAERANAEEVREQAKRQIAMAELEYANAMRIREQARAELEKAQMMREEAKRKMDSAILDITCRACKQHLRAGLDRGLFAMSYLSSGITEGEREWCVAESLYM